MKSICLVPLISIICLHAFAQKHDSTTAFNVLIGQSFPTGKFAHANDITDNLGPAKGGEFLKLSITHKITNRIAIGAQLQFQRNPLNTNSLEEDLNNGNFFSGFTLIGITYPPPSLPPPPSSSPLKNWIVNKSSWYVASILVGGSAHFPISANNKWSVFVGAQVGGVYASTPKIDAQAVTDSLQLVVHQDSHSSFGFAYELSSGFNYRLNKNLSLALQCDYFATGKMKYSQVKTNSVAWQPGIFGMHSYSQFSRDISQAISCVNVGIGLSFSL